MHVLFLRKRGCMPSIYSWGFASIIDSNCCRNLLQCYFIVKIYTSAYAYASMFMGTAISSGLPGESFSVLRFNNSLKYFFHSSLTVEGSCTTSPDLLSTDPGKFVLEVLPMKFQKALGLFHCLSRSLSCLLLACFLLLLCTFLLNSLCFSRYRRDWLIGACAYRLQQQENMRLLYVCAY